MIKSEETTRFDDCLIAAANEPSHREYRCIDKLIELADSSEAGNILQKIQSTYRNLYHRILLKIPAQMKKIVSIIRITILSALGLLAALLLLGEETDPSMPAFLIDKSIGFAACLTIGRLYKRWSKVDPWLIAFDKMGDEDTDIHNS